MTGLAERGECGIIDELIMFVFHGGFQGMHFGAGMGFHLLDCGLAENTFHEGGQKAP